MEPEVPRRGEQASARPGASPVPAGSGPARARLRSAAPSPRTLGKLALSLFLFSAASWADEPFSQKFEALLEEHALPGAVVLINRGDTTLHHQAYGKVNRDRPAEMQKDTIFRIDSMSKPITAFALLQLVDRGQVSLDDDIRKHLPAFAAFEHDGKPQVITIHQLLSHTAGFGYGIGVMEASGGKRYPGSFFWAGMGGTLFWVDPVADVQVIVMMQVEDGWIALDRWMSTEVHDLLKRQGTASPRAAAGERASRAAGEARDGRPPAGRRPIPSARASKTASRSVGSHARCVATTRVRSPVRCPHRRRMMR